jgi:chaperonin GroES
MPNAANRLVDAIEIEGVEITDAVQRIDGDALTLADILTPNVNLAEALTENELATIGSRVISDVQLDEASRGKGSDGKGPSGYLERYRRWLDMAMQVREAKNFPWPNAANVKFPLLTVAAIQFQARAYPAIVDGSNLVKGRVLGPDEDGQKRARADRIGQHMTWQLLYRMPGWEEETDRLLLMLPITGCVFRKTYFDSIANANCSEMVSSEDFVINYWAKSLDSAPRYTHILRYYPHEVLEKIQGGLWLEVSPAVLGEDGSDEEALIDFYEQHRNIDLDGDGYPEPYVVTATKEGKVVRIVPCFGKDEVTVATSVGLFSLAEIEEGGLEPIRIVKIERRQYFTKYGFIPAPDGSFYDIGFGALLEDISETTNATINQMLNAGALQNAGGGFLGSGINQKGGNLTFRLGEWKRLDVANSTPLRDNIFRMEHPGPSAVLFNLLGMLIQSAKEITSVQDVMTGEGRANQPATTTLALIEQGHKTMTAIFKRIHRSFGQELRILRRLNRDYLDEEEYFQLNDSEEAVQVGKTDYEDRDLDVMPTSDPNMVSDMQKLARAQALMMFNGDPLVNQLAIREISLEAMGLSAEKKRLLTVPQPPPDPKVLIEGMKEARAKLESEAKVHSLSAKAALDALTAAEKAYALGALPDAASLLMAAVSLGGTIDDDVELAAGPGQLPGMEGQPPDAGLPPIPEGPPLGPDGGMGLGAPELGEPGGAGVGGPAGPAGGDQF